MNNNALYISILKFDRSLKIIQLAPLRALLQRLGEHLNRWQLNRRTRQQMVHLDSYQLNDIGVSLGEALEEADKPFWRD